MGKPLLCTWRWMTLDPLLNREPCHSGAHTGAGLCAKASSAHSAPADWPPSAPSRVAGRQRRSIQLDLEDLEELNTALAEAMQAAEGIRSTTKHMSRSLSADLRQA